MNVNPSSSTKITMSLTHTSSCNDIQNNTMVRYSERVIVITMYILWTQSMLLVWMRLLVFMSMMSNLAFMTIVVLTTILMMILTMILIMLRMMIPMMILMMVGADRGPRTKDRSSLPGEAVCFPFPGHPSLSPPFRGVGGRTNIWGLDPVWEKEQRR